MTTLHISHGNWHHLQLHEFWGKFSIGRILCRTSLKCPCRGSSCLTALMHLAIICPRQTSQVPGLCKWKETDLLCLNRQSFVSTTVVWCQYFWSPTTSCTSAAQSPRQGRYLLTLGTRQVSHIWVHSTEAILLLSPWYSGAENEYFSMQSCQIFNSLLM